VLIAASMFALGSLGAHANNSQQSKMTTCNADATAKGLKGSGMTTATPTAPATTK
jgi:hypothetical protein